MPGSGKKGRNRSGDAETSSQGSVGDGVDPALIRFLNAMKEDIVQSTKETVGRLESRLDKTEQGLAALEKKVEETDRRVADQIVAEVARTRPTLVPVPAGDNSVASVHSRREAAYHRCRRSLKIWPIEGEDLPDAVRVFLRTKLKIGDAKIDRMGSIEVSTMPNKTARDRKEVVATFESSEDRDYVKACGPQLAGQREVGMALHVPGHLLDNLASLNGLAYSIKQKNSTTRRAVKFDDEAMDVYLDICIAGNWRKVTPKEAKQALKEVPSTSASSTLSVSDLTNLIQGKEVPGLTVTVVPDDTMDE